jgi:hypothetical protein
MEAPVPGEKRVDRSCLGSNQGQSVWIVGAAAKLGIPASTLESKI